MTKPRDPGSPRAALDDLFRTCGHKTAADFLGRSVHALYKVTDPEEDRDLGFRQVSQLTRVFRATAAAEHLAAQAGGVFLPLPDPAESELSQLTGQGLTEVAEAVRIVLDAEATTSEGGRHKTARELRAIVAEIDDVIRIFARARAVCLAQLDPEEANVTPLRREA